MFLAHMQDHEGPRSVCMQRNGTEGYNIFFGNALTTLPALSPFTAFDKAVDAPNVVTFHVTEQLNSNDATESLSDLLV